MINTNTKLGELLTNDNEIIRRNATSILKTAQKDITCKYCKVYHKNSIECRYYGSGVRGNEI